MRLFPGDGEFYENRSVYSHPQPRHKQASSIRGGLNVTVKLRITIIYLCDCVT